jgi:hypothetical protein
VAPAREVATTASITAGSSISVAMTASAGAQVLRRAQVSAASLRESGRCCDAADWDGDTEGVDGCRREPSSRAGRPCRCIGQIWPGANPSQQESP